MQLFLQLATTARQGGGGYFNLQRGLFWASTDSGTESRAENTKWQILSRLSGGYFLPLPSQKKKGQGSANRKTSLLVRALAITARIQERKRKKKDSECLFSSATFPNFTLKHRRAPWTSGGSLNQTISAQDLERFPEQHSICQHL